MAIRAATPANAKTNHRKVFQRNRERMTHQTPLKTVAAATLTANKKHSGHTQSEKLRVPPGRNCVAANKSKKIAAAKINHSRKPRARFLSRISFCPSFMKYDYALDHTVPCNSRPLV